MGARSAGAAALARARSAFLSSEPFDPAAVRPPILASWSRSRERAVPVDGLSVPYRPDVDAETPLARAAARVLAELGDTLGTEPVSLVLCNGAGTVLRRSTGDARLARALDRVQLAPGFVYAEQHVGTNGIGVSLANAEPARVFGHEHFAEHLEHLACAAAPVRHPLTGEVAGVGLAAGQVHDAGALLLTTVTSLARQIREALLEEAGRRERALLDGFLAACRNDAAPVLAAGRDVVLLNQRARELLGPQAQALVLGEAMAALSTGRAEVVVDLPDGQRARVRCTATSERCRDGDVVVQVQLAAPRAAVPARPAAPAVPDVPAVPAAPPTQAGPPAAARAGTGRLIVAGEPGAGCTRRAVAGRPAQVLDAAEARPDAVLRALQEGDRVVLEHVDRMGTPALRELTAWLGEEAAERPQPPEVVVTTAPLPARPPPALAELLALFPAPVLVPPLRARRADLPQLAARLLADVAGGRPLRLSPDALGVLAALPWPGNVAQLRQVLATAAASRRTGTIEAADLPSDLVALARRPLTPLEVLERDALLTALARAHGSKDAAARALGLSRATVYRRVRQLGLSAV
ncbi:MAG TPA: helix-turn-helix domain-containing protein [Mycobacteriales bacterium]|nr:helix-turn-helix domain-containing protein [Mycobacteriales bacterium]